ncbi:unnamed protein product [Medioppia subpectinata]|uniref:C2H2-type domain-containing protein n=1 Tax=Medioppia subpectinata TaxID=1979941 RepID=A0A7R9KCE9_9ACAR|nr:unnamed protein product [Medioppia subpectinata]CAG2100907.1 unnamed protein product [Medioppia subpectinata]
MDQSSGGIILSDMNDQQIRYNTSWDSRQLCHQLLQMNVISSEESKILTEQRIDGLTFLLMTENNFNELGFLLGPKIKILNFISNIKRHIEVDYDLNESKLMPKETIQSSMTSIQTKNERGSGDVPEANDSKPESEGHKPVKSPKTSRSHKCRECDKTYSKVQYVRDHEMTVHYNSGPNYSCRVCGQTFGWRVTILNHIKKYHPEHRCTTQMVVKLF